MIRIFSYLPNPRVWKSLIAADYVAADVEVVGDLPRNLSQWLWDFDARELPEDERHPDNEHARVSRRGFSGTLYKTDRFLKAHPYGTVPAAFGGGGDVGIFESNSILRAVARSGTRTHQLYGDGPLSASRIDSFLDATLVFGREAQVYLLAVKELSQETHARMSAAFEFYLTGIEGALANSDYIAGDTLSIADIAFVCDFCQFLRERLMGKDLAQADLPMISAGAEQTMPLTFAHLHKLLDEPAFANYLGDYTAHLRPNSA